MFSGKGIVRAALIAAALVQFGFAQMMGGGMNGGGTSTGMMGSTGSGMSVGMGGGMQGTMGSGMGAMMPGPVVGSDGTACLLRTTTSTAASITTVKRELIAVNYQTGKANWKLQIDGTMISDPVFGKDGLIYLTTSEPPVGSTAATLKPALVVVAPASSSARVQNRVELAGDILSAPVISPDGQTIYVVATDMPTGSTAATTPTLYGFSPGGALKFKVLLSQL